MGPDWTKAMAAVASSQIWYLAFNVRKSNSLKKTNKGQTDKREGCGSLVHVTPTNGSYLFSILVYVLEAIPRPPSFISRQLSLVFRLSVLTISFFRSSEKTFFFGGGEGLMWVPDESTALFPLPPALLHY